MSIHHLRAVQPETVASSAKVISLAFMVSGTAVAAPLEYPTGNLWSDEKTVPMESCVAKFSFVANEWMLIPPLSTQKTKLMSLREENGQIVAQARRQVGCVYDCIVASKDKFLSPVICTKTGSV